MSVSRALYASWKCQKCQHTAIKAFSSLASASIAPRPRFQNSATCAARIRSIQSSGRRCLSFTTAKAFPDQDLASAGPQEGVHENASLDDSTEDPLPWYLQLQDEGAPETTLLERQRLPDVPSNCPERLTEIVKYLSEGIGMESIALLDLRSLDPPPALGSNLIMLVSTARSIRHLNVSADRLCRWLRANYQLRPYADGLLGRRELKLKLRRKARRAKILGSKPRPTDGDDGITTGWICVNIGSINPSNRGDELLHGDSGDVVGFGQQETGIHLVVQMLTEEKRESLQLEELWTEFLNRQAGEQQVESRGPSVTDDAVAEAYGDVVNAGEGPDIVPEAHPSLGPHKSSISPPTIQRRGLHMRAQLLASSGSTGEPVSGTDAASGSLEDVSKDASSQPASVAGQAERNLWSQLNYLLVLSPSEARTALGKGWQDRTSTPFLASFYGEMSLFPTVNEYRAWLALMQYGIQIQHGGYTIEGMLSVFREMQHNLLSIPEDIFNKILKHVAQPENIQAVELNEGADLKPLSTILDIIEDMDLRDHCIRTQTVIDILFLTVSAMKQRNPSVAAQYLHPQITAQLERLTHDYKCHVPSPETHFTAIEELAAAHRWEDLWNLWMGFPIREEPRSAALYAAVFRCVAREKHQRACIEAIMRLTATMAIEDPPVAVEGETAVAMMECLKVADPQVQAQWEDGGYASKPYVRLFQSCINGLRDRDWYEEDQYTL